ncbi:MAG: glycosyltransferase [Pseudomonadota bacterium]
MKKLSIVQVAPPQDTGLGDYYYRMDSPGRALSALEGVRTVVSITNIHRHKEILMRDADILVINHVCDADLLPIIKDRRERGFPTVFEVGDNINDIQPWNLTFPFWQNEENRSLFCTLVSECDALQANNKELLNEFGHLNKRHALFPNQMGEVIQEGEGVREKDFIIGWGGSHGHLDDLKWIAPALIPWFRDHPEARLAIMGSEEIFKVFEGIPSEQKIYYKPGTIHEYYDFLKEIDIGLAPLKDTAYNRCRSDVKFIEYAAFRVVPVLQDLNPYQDSGITGGSRYLFRDPGELVHILDKLSSNREFRDSITKRALDYVITSRKESDHAAGRLEFYRELLNGGYVEKGHENGILGSLSGYVPYTETEFEQCLYNGLIYLETRDMPQEARALFIRAERLGPDNYLPNLFASKCVMNPVSELKKALMKNSLSLKTLTLLGEAYQKRGDAQSALETFRALIEYFPEYDIPYRRSADVMESLGMLEDAGKLRRMVSNGKPLLSHPAPVEKAKGGIILHKELERRELYLIMPRGNDYGWGICGKYLAKEMSAFADVKYITETFTVQDIGDELDHRLLKELLLPKDEFDRVMSTAKSSPIDVPVIQAISGNNLFPWGPRINSKKRVGYTFFEDNVLPRQGIENAKEYYEILVAGSRWCEEVLKGHGIENTSTIIQGIDPTIFHPAHNQKEYFKDRFVIFSGGKFELRKGQDLVIRAFRHLSERYQDVLLVNAWYNKWTPSLQTMGASKFIDFVMDDHDYMAFVEKLLQRNGIDPARVICLPPKPNISMPRIYKNTDIGLFPNRCEGGTNLVLMEYMACGKPVIASYSTGHKDILTEENALLLKKMNSIDIKKEGRLLAIWDEPDLDEVIERLEWAYLHRDDLDGIAQTAGKDLSGLTWQESAKAFYELAMG